MYCEKCGRLAHGDRPCSGTTPDSITTQPRYSPATVRRYSPRKPAVEGLLAALLSFFLPGLGQMCQGRFGAGFAFFFCLFIVGMFMFIFWPLGCLLYLFVMIVAVVDAARQ